LARGKTRGLLLNRTYLSPPYEHQTDDYDRKKALLKAELDAHHSKMQEKPFSSKVSPRGTFSTIKEAYGEDREYPNRSPPARRSPLMTHDTAFKPSNPPKKGRFGTLDKFPEYKEDPVRVAMRQPEQKEDRPKWKPNYKGSTVPSSSISTSVKNLKTEFPSVFTRV